MMMMKTNVVSTKCEGEQIYFNIVIVLMLKNYK